jgi:hypothetical protein
MSAAEEIAQTYAPTMTGAAPATAPMAAPAAAPMAGAPTADAERTRAQIIALRQEAARTGDKRFSARADELEKVLDLTDTSIDPTKRYLNLGDGVAFDTLTGKHIVNPARAEKVGTLVSVVGPDGRPVMVPAAQAVGMAPGSEAEKIPKDFRKLPDGSLEVVPGSPTDKKNKDNASVAATTVDAAIKNIDALIGPAGNYTPHPGLASATGPLDVKTPTLFTDTANAEAYIQSLQAKASLEGLRTIRGQAGAIGQITEKEWPRLENLLATLQASQGTDQFVKSLNDYRNALLNVKNQVSAATNAGPAAGGGVTVTAPNGQTYSFANQSAADQFKQAAGIQ